MSVWAFGKENQTVDDFHPIVVKRRIPPTYPNWAYTHGIGQGYAEVAFYVDELGELSDFLMIEYSHEVFADSLLKSVQGWEFQPAYKKGRPVKSVCQAYWEFYPDRPIETNALFDTSKRMEGLDKPDFRKLKYRKEAELDEKPRMLRFAEIVVPEGYRLADPKARSLTVRCNFFIDGNGQVALPVVEASSDPALDYEVMEAFKRALFEPPIYKNKPTVAWMEKTYMIPLAQ